MAEPRPFARYEVSELEALFASRDMSPDQLRALAEELEKRTSTRATMLWKKVRAAMLLGAVPAPRENHRGSRYESRIATDRATVRPLAADPAVVEAERRFGPVLERVRKRLLDLTANNTLLNYRHPKASSLRVVDEVPAQVFELLLADEGMAVVGLPDPDQVKLKHFETADPLADLPLGSAIATQAPIVDSSGVSSDPRDVVRAERKAAAARRDALRRRIAGQLGINTSFELPATPSSAARNHQDKKLQTLLFPEELEEQLRKLRRTAETVIEETGANRLHLMLGFVEWHESGQSESERVLRLAPLVLLPVRLTRGKLDEDTGTYRYAVERTGEDWSANVSLQEKCRVDFGIGIPDVNTEDYETLEHYFERVETILAQARPTWTLKRFVTLGIVSFGKVLMWRDLDPKNWPAEQPLLSNQALRDLLGAEGMGVDESSSPTAVGVDYPLDRLAETDPAQVPPIVMDADSSQHSALVDVARGVNLVLQGPPGTGKSQTIANLIASALGTGKRILFIAEKKAALDVVLRRLQRAGLGDYCLALHSHTSAKKEFIAELAERLATRGRVPAPKRLADHETRYRDARTVLNEHAAQMHEPLEKCGLTPFEVFWRAQRLSGRFDERQFAAIRAVRIGQVAHSSLDDIQRRRDLIEEFAGAYRNVSAEAGALWRHPWAGVCNPQLTFPDVNDLLDLAHALRQPLGALELIVDKLEHLIEGEVGRSAQSLRAMCGMIERLEPLEAHANDDLPALIVTSSDVPHVRAAVAAVEYSRACWGRIAGPWHVPDALRRERAHEIDQVLGKLAANVGLSATVLELREVTSKARTTLATLRAAAAIVEKISEALGGLDPNPPLATAAVIIEVVRDTVAIHSKSPEALSLRTTALTEPATVVAIRRLGEEAMRLRARRTRLDQEFLPSLRPSSVGLRKMVNAFSTAPRVLPWLLSGAYREASRDYRSMTGGVRAKRATMSASAIVLLRFAEQMAAFDAERRVLASVFGDTNAGIDSPFEAALDVIEWRETLRRRAVVLQEAGRALVDQVWTISTDSWLEALERVRVRPEYWDAAVALGATMETAALVPGMTSVIAPDMTLRDSASALESFVRDFDQCIKFAEEAQLQETQPIGELGALLGLLRVAWQSEEALTERAGVLASLGIAFAGAATDVEPVKEALEYVVQLGATGLPGAVTGWLLGRGARLRLRGLQEVADGVIAAINDFERAATSFCDAAVLDQGLWSRASFDDGATKTGPADSLFSEPLAMQSARLEYALQRDKALHPWAVYQHSRAAAITDGLQQIVSLIEEEHVRSEDAADAYEAAFYRSLADLVLGASSALDHFDSGKHSEIQRRFVDLDIELQRLAQLQISHQLSGVPVIAGNPGPRVCDLTEEALLQHNVNLQRRHSAIRELFRRAGRSILSLKPCFLMGPQAVAQYLQPGKFEFDLVVMDEASQMRPEDALGAIARARQVVVVGDPMQLGPTRFFDKAEREDDDAIEDGGENDEDEPEEVPPVTGATVLERSESILLAAAARYGVRMLRWHYRSRHPKLIAFSNREFYHERLIIFPTSGVGDAHDGVFLRRVSGVYGARRNVPEAQEIVSAIRAHAAAYPARSLLVASMNAEQADLIDALVGQAEKEDPILAEFLSRHDGSLEPFAIKNLENVQGDERDVIFVSVTFGPDAHGRLMQRFGPILQSGGERRLNVLFTRAKHRLEVFCSFDPNDLRVSGASPRGLRVLRDYLKFASGEVWWASGTESGREPDSDFEVAIADALSARGYETRPQVGVAGYFIDMAVVHPDSPGRFILGIEADGATYHSAKTARDRDRLRQAQLEALGWTIHRVWSTDFFKDPAGQVSRIVARIESIRNAEVSRGWNSATEAPCHVD